MIRAYSFAGWKKQFEDAFAGGRFLPNEATMARGTLLLAQNDEPEPGDLTEADLAEIDRQFNIGRADRADRRALVEQVNHPLGPA